MDKIIKFLLKINEKERGVLLELIEKILANTLSNLDIKQLKGDNNFFRVRKGKFRIIFKKDGERNNTIINIDYRGNIYK